MFGEEWTQLFTFTSLVSHIYASWFMFVGEGQTQQWMKLAQLERPEGDL